MLLASPLQHHEVSMWCSFLYGSHRRHLWNHHHYWVIAQCTDFQVLQRKAPRCCYLAIMAQCPHHCPVQGACLGCHWCCCYVSELHRFCGIQGWIRQPKTTWELYMLQIKMAGRGWKLPVGDHYQNPTLGPTHSVQHGTGRIWSHTGLALGHCTVLVFQL